MRMHTLHSNRYHDHIMITDCSARFWIRVNVNVAGPLGGESYKCWLRVIVGNERICLREVRCKFDHDA